MRPEIATCRTKTFIFTQVKHIDWLAKIELRGLGPPGRQYYCSLLLYASMLKAKMLRETETEETIGFLVTFYHFTFYQ